MLEEIIEVISSVGEPVGDIMLPTELLHLSLLELCVWSECVHSCVNLKCVMCVGAKRVHTKVKRGGLLPVSETVCVYSDDNTH